MRDPLPSHTLTIIPFPDFQETSDRVIYACAGAGRAPVRYLQKY